MDNVVQMLKDFIAKAERGDIPLEDVVYTGNFVENMVIDQYRAGKISYEVVCKIVYGETNNGDSK